jgi:hypothetical protein
MRVRPFVQTYVGNVISILTLIAIIDCAVIWAQSEAVVQPTHGKYMGQSWYIDADHLLWWQGKPYVRYGFTGNGDVDRFMENGFSQFNAYPSEELWVFSKDPARNQQAVRKVNEFTDFLQEKGATYYAGLNLLWPWSGSGKIAEEDMVDCVFRKVWEITEFSQKKDALELEFISDIPLEVNRQNIQIYLFDFAKGQHTDISDKLKDVQTAEKTIKESASERYRATTHKLRFESMLLPNYSELSVTVLVQVALPTVPGMYPGSFPALWKPGIQQYYRNGLQQFRAAYRKRGLRGMMFGDEINTHRVSLTHMGLHVDFSRDTIALSAYRKWLGRRYDTIARLNDALTSNYQSFNDVKWQVCIYPFIENDSEDRNYGLSQQTFGLYKSAEQFEMIDRLQEEFRVWFYGHWLARYAKMAKEAIGDVPVFITSAGITGDAEGYLQIHKHSMLEGIEGLVRNHYAWVERDAHGRLSTFAARSKIRFPLETVTTLLDSIQQECGSTKTYFANEFGHPQRGGDDFVDDFGLGNAFSFPSKEELRNFLLVLIENGCKGFNMFKMNPNVPAAQKEVEWFSQLKPDIVQKTIETTDYRKLIRITAKEAISIARKHPKLRKWLEKYSRAKAMASFNEHYSVWIVEFIENNREIGFASVSLDGQVLESKTR